MHFCRVNLINTTGTNPLYGKAPEMFSDLICLFFFPGFGKVFFA